MEDLDRRLLLLGAGLAGVGLAQAGSLNPPGAPAPTGRTLGEVEPRTPIPGGTAPFLITQSGSYYLAGNMNVTGDAITVQGVIDVTIDLNGFRVNATANGVVAPAARLRISNGTVLTGVGGGRCIDAGMSSVVANLTVFGGQGNPGSGIRVGQRSRVIGCTAEVSNIGIETAARCVVDSCVVGLQTPAFTGSRGIVVQGPSRVIDCEVNGGERGIHVDGTGDPSGGSLVRGCSIVSSEATRKTGVHVTARGVTVTDCMFSGVAPAILIESNMGFNYRIERNHVTNSGTGFALNGLAGLCVGNTVLTGNTGISGGGGSTGPKLSGAITASTSPWVNILDEGGII